MNGACIGYGLTGALVADFLIASDRALFGMPEVKIGVPTIVGSMRMPHKIGWANAMEILLTGDNIDAERAREMGLALEGRAARLADGMKRERWQRGSAKGAPLAVRAVKEVAWRSQRMGWTEALRMGEAIRRIVGDSEDAKEGGRAFFEKRPPEWTGA